MSQQPERLIVRRHDRVECELRGAIRLCDEHSGQIAFSRAVVETDGSVSVRIVDCSLGGLGIDAAVFLPRGARFDVEFTLPGEGSRSTLALRVQRCSMVDRTPRYYIGSSIPDSGADLALLERLLGAMSDAGEHPGEAA